MLKTAHPAQWLIVACFGVFLGQSLIRAAAGDPERGFHYREFGSVPVVEGGRVKPLDTFARGQLILLNGRSEFKDEDGKTYPATKWLLDVMATNVPKLTGPALGYKMFRIENLEVLDLLHLEKRPGNWRYAINEFAKSLDDLQKIKDEAKRARKKAGKDRSVYESKIIELDGHLGLFMAIASWHSPGMIPTSGEDWLALGEAYQMAAGNDGQFDEQKLNPLAALIGYDLIGSHVRDNPERFDQAIKLYHDAFNAKMPELMNTVGLEAYFNQLEPFYVCAVAYGLAFVLAVISWFGFLRPERAPFQTLNRGAFWSMVLIALLHSWAILVRIYILQRPPVINLYSSAVFIGWGCVMTCLIFEYYFRYSIALAVGAITGGLSLIVAHFLSLESSDTMEMMRAVLDTNFWLATHVTCVTLGYTATFVAGFIGITYVAAMVCSTGLDWLTQRNEGFRQRVQGSTSREISGDFFSRTFETTVSPIFGKMIYGVVCFAMFLSFTGTVLGGLWADYSWGRFWGWDPKENGALLIVIWCALILHARWGGMVKHRGMALLAVLGNIVTSWSWFGTNFFGVGLHTYGFMAGAMQWLAAFDVAMLMIVGVGLLPLKEWAKAPAKPRLQEAAPASASLASR
jgi:ABC-type transport system involved in cytochrome c biogenesis permease subunit